MKYIPCGEYFNQSYVYPNLKNIFKNKKDYILHDMQYKYNLKNKFKIKKGIYIIHTMLNKEIDIYNTHQ